MWDAMNVFEIIRTKSCLSGLQRSELEEAPDALGKVRTTIFAIGL